MQYIIDRFEDSFALLERADRTIIKVEKALLPKSAKEGDCILYNQGEYLIDEAQTARRKENINNLINDLFI